MSEGAALMLGLGIAAAGWFIAHGLDAIGDAICKLAERR